MTTTYTLGYAGSEVDGSIQFVQNSVADSYSASSTYNIGDYVIYNNKLWRCTTAISTAEGWTAAHWTETQIMDETDITVDATPTEGSTNPVSSGGVYTALEDKQDILTAGSNITITDNTIAATDTTYTAGDGISISSNTISADVTDVQINGTSITSSGVANIPYANVGGTPGVIRINPDYKASITQGYLQATNGSALQFIDDWSNFAFVGKGVLSNLRTYGWLQGNLSGATAGDILTVNSSGNMQDSGKAFVTEMPASPTDNEILTAQGTQEYADPKGYLTLSGTQYQVAVSSTDAGTAGYITFVVGA